MFYHFEEIHKSIEDRNAQSIDIFITVVSVIFYDPDFDITDSATSDGFDCIVFVERDAKIKKQTCSTIGRRLTDNSATSKIS